MKQIKKFSDARLDNYCVYCGANPDTRDHVPSKIILDEPFPENLPVVLSCNECNQGFSKDEEYFACLIECVLRGTTELDKMERIKIKNVLERKPDLRARITESMVVKDGQTYFKGEEERIRNVIMKLARGHVSYEISELQFEEPSFVSIRPFMAMNEDEQNEYLFPELNLSLLPEIGSRGFQRMFLNDNSFINNWVVVQEDKYMYSITYGGPISVKFLIWNYFACEVRWD